MTLKIDECVVYNIEKWKPNHLSTHGIQKTEEGQFDRMFYVLKKCVKISLITSIS